MIASDGWILSLGQGVPHPRAYGTFPRVLGRYSREKGILEMEDAVRKMTSLPAQRIGQFDRGLLRPGMKADVTIFDPDTIIDRAEFGDPHKYSDGIHFVIINGEVVLDDGKMTAVRPGEISLRGGEEVTGGCISASVGANDARRLNSRWNCFGTEKPSWTPLGADSRPP